MTATLVLLRHGASEWSEGERFTGTVDVPLSAGGAEQAGRAGRLLASAGLVPDVVFTSTLRRAMQSADALLDVVGEARIEVHPEARLDERSYGEWEGRNKREVAEEVGDERFVLWRRSFDAAPHGAETLREVLARVLSFWREEALPRLTPDAVVLVVSHSNVLRALIMHLDGLDARQIVGVDVPNGVPLIYDVEQDGVRRRGYLDDSAR